MRLPFNSLLPLGAVTLLICSACATVRISQANIWTPAVHPLQPWQDGNGSYTVPDAATAMQKKTVFVLFWGFNQENVFATNCPGDGLAEVRISTNVGFALITVVTFGFIQPITVQWTCAKQSPTTMKDF